MKDLTESYRSWASFSPGHAYAVFLREDGTVLVIDSQDMHSLRVKLDAIEYDSLYELYELAPETEIPWAMLNTWDPTNGTCWWLPLKDSENYNFEKPACNFPCHLNRVFRERLVELYEERKADVTARILAAREKGEQPAFFDCRVGKKASCNDGRCPCSSVLSWAIEHRS